MSYRAPIVSKFENPPPGESEIIAEIRDRIERQLERDLRAAQKKDPKALMLRDQHAKHHGCVEATFEIRTDIPKAYQQGIFQPGRKYQAWIRFSNGGPMRQDDRKADGRGMAIKVMGVPGKKLLEGIFTESLYSREEKDAQDFILLNHPVHFVPDLKTYSVFTRLTHRRSLLLSSMFFLSWPRLAAIVWNILKKKMYNPLHVTYHSMTPYLLGQDQAVKFSAVPVSVDDGLPIPDTPGPRSSRDYLREAMARSLDPASGRAARFDLRAHVRKDENLPIEDPTVLWPEEGAPKLSLATITIEPQEFQSEERIRFSEALSFSPWHTVPEHQPLGGINRARLAIYQSISELRHKTNKMPAIDPAARASS